MGDAADEARALQELEQRRTAELLRIEAEKEAARQRAAEEAAKKSSMVADPEQAAPNWPDDGFQAEAPGRLQAVQGALGVGHAGDVAFAQKLLNSGQAPLGSVSAPEQSAAGSKEGSAGARTGAKPALGLG
ncbi:hypothetical protein GCM10009630_33320 [Kribbella jejuensis]|uniref:Uncharacterized protein n=1 Tax=Kribbella jejuensis TaxID=236068 RepID=A0A542DTB1_9ACTN|nr:hypothetical protein [Kribbella jejuensis]TQJ06327.1 hypothetical protein FB475_5987 [Kribbella jejuensis]